MRLPLLVSLEPCALLGLDSAGNEVDLILEKQGQVIALEVKSGQKIRPEMFSGIRYWQKYNPGSLGVLLYGGNKSEWHDPAISILGWKEVVNV